MWNSISNVADWSVEPAFLDNQPTPTLSCSLASHAQKDWKKVKAYHEGGSCEKVNPFEGQGKTLQEHQHSRCQSPGGGYCREKCRANWGRPEKVMGNRGKTKNFSIFQLIFLTKEIGPIYLLWGKKKVISKTGKSTKKYYIRSDDKHLVWVKWKTPFKDKPDIRWSAEVQGQFANKNSVLRRYTWVVWFSRNFQILTMINLHSGYSK